MYSPKSVGDALHPCFTPSGTGNFPINSPSTHTYPYTSAYNYHKHRTISFATPNSPHNTLNNFCLGTVSYAAFKSTKQRYKSYLWSRRYYPIISNIYALSSNLWNFLNPLCSTALSYLLVISYSNLKSTHLVYHFASGYNKLIPR